MGRLLARLLFAAALALASEARAQGPMFEVVTGSADVPQPIHIANAGDARLFIVSRPGVIYVVQDGAVLPTPFLDITDLVGVMGEGGLLSMAFDPGYATNGRVFVSYTNNDDDSVLARYERSGSDPNTLDPTTGHVLLTVDQPAGRFNHKGGQLQFGADGYLYFGLGDGGSGNDPDCLAQDDGSLLGKMLRLDVDVAPDVSPWHETPATNPHVGATAPFDLIWASGFRNPWRFSFDRDTGYLWIGDVGQDTREEIDREPAGDAGGRNYGWKRVEGTVCRYDDMTDVPGCGVQPPTCSDPGYTAPVFDYATVSSSGRHAITGGFVYRGASAPAFQGRYVFADSSSGELLALQPGGAGPADVLSNELSVPASFGEDAAGELYLADLGKERVYRLHLDRAGAAAAAERCVNAANARVAKYTTAAEKDVRACVTLAARGKLGAQTLAQCSEADREGALAKQQTALEQVEATRCTPAPAFGFGGSATAGAAAEASGRDLAELVFGADLDAAIATNDGDRVTAACQQAVLKGLSSCQGARRKELLRCKKAGLKDGTIDSAETLAACITSDANGRVARACDPAAGPLVSRTLPRKCAAPGVDLAGAFPGCADASVAGLAQCLDVAGRCAHCRTFVAADALDVDCEQICAEIQPP